MDMGCVVMEFTEKVINESVIELIGVLADMMVDGDIRASSIDMSYTHVSIIGAVINGALCLDVDLVVRALVRTSLCTYSVAAEILSVIV